MHKLRINALNGVPEKRLLLINPPFPKKLQGVPLGLLHLAGSLKRKDSGFRGEVCLLDLNVSENPAKELNDALSSFRPTHAGITRFSPTAKEGMEILRDVKNRSHSTITISGGPHEVFCGENTLRKFGGKGEGIVDHVVSSFDGIADFSRILGTRAMGGTLNQLPAYELLGDAQAYQFEGMFGKRMMQMILSLGCTKSCSFCHHGKYTPATKETAISSIRHALSNSFGAIFFEDLDIASSRKRLSMLLSLFKRFGFEWGCKARADKLTGEGIAIMHNSGCRYISMGLDPEGMKQGLPHQVVAEVSHLIKKAGISLGIYAMFGYLEGNTDLDKATLRTIEEIAPDYFSASILARYPGPSSPQWLIDGYENGEFCRQEQWFPFDEGWGAHHPFAGQDCPRWLRDEILERTHINPEIWDRIKSNFSS